MSCHGSKGSTGIDIPVSSPTRSLLGIVGIQNAEMARVPTPVIEDAKRRRWALHLENFQYHKRAKAAHAKDDSVVFVETFGKLHIPTLLQQQFGSEDGEKAAVMELNGKSMSARVWLPLTAPLTT